ncbi:extended synaptotagmin-3 [Erpetoichthys calabaricus]|uniref:Extended synaptotagmin-3 n=1 Tax=Erpetoichthys calabaricus TaxID=27687 RepID=A0A8C4S1Z6_ERPCA|nr:extended synaptotagmin-3 [Erpetoichthys calabaricus]
MSLSSETKKTSRKTGVNFCDTPTTISSEEPVDAPSTVNQVLLELLGYFGRAFLYLFPVYLIGYLGLSVSWLLFGLMVWTWWRRNRKWKKSRLARALEFLENEKQLIIEGIKDLDLPAWVHFPDIEKADWLNKLLKQAWPYFGIYMEKMLQDTIEPAIRASSIHLKTFTFSKINFGEKALKINGVKVYTKEVDKRQVIIDLQLSYIGDCEINVEVKKLCKAGVKGVQLHGTLRVILEPLVGQVPFVGGITIFFIRRPLLEVNWTGLTNLLDVPGFSDMSDAKILELVSSYLVLPKRLCIPLIDKIQVAQLKFPLPHGVVRVHLEAAKDLVRKDTYLMGMVKGKSDPYAILRVGTQTHRSRTIKEELNPSWKEVYEFVVHEAPGQDLDVELFDEDPDKDDFLGSLCIDLGEVMKDRVVDEWFPLNDIESGEVHLKLEWLSLLVDQQRLVENNQRRPCAILVIYLDSACNLPRNQFEYSNNEYGLKKTKTPKYIKLTKNKSNGEPCSYVEFSTDKESQKSKVSYSTKDPVWEEPFTFLVHNVHSQSLNIEVKDDDRNCALGTLTIPLYRILTASEMTLDQRFQLDHSGPSSTIKMKLLLRILTLEEPDPDSIYTGLNALKKVPLSIKKKKVPSKSEPSPSEQKKHELFMRPTSGLHYASSETNLDKEKVQHSFRTAVVTDPKPAGVATPVARKSSVLQPNRKTETTSMISDISVCSSHFDLIDGQLPLPNGTSSDGVSLGQINVSVHYTSVRHHLIVHVNECRNLIPSSQSGSDPYVRIYLLPDRSWANRKRTSVKKKTLDPVFNEKFEFPVSQDEVKKRKLEIAVKNNRSFTSHERKELGKVEIDLSKEDLIKGFTQWYELSLNGL